MQNYNRLFNTLACLLILTGCNLNQSNKPIDNTPAKTYTFEQIQTGINTRIESLTQLWSRGVIELRWTDKEGKKQFEQGDVVIISRRPRDLAMKIFKADFDFAWIGCDKHSYWMFDLNPPKGQPVAAYLGRSKTLPQNSDGLLIPIHPHRLIELLGISPIPNAHPKHPPVVSYTDKQLVQVKMPAYLDADNNPTSYIQYAINPDKWQITHITITDTTDKILLNASLSRYERATMAGRPPSGYIEVPTRIEADLKDQNANIILFLDSPEDGVEGKRVRDVQFDFDKLIDLHEAKILRNLDKPISPQKETK